MERRNTPQKKKSSNRGSQQKSKKQVSVDELEPSARPDATAPGAQGKIGVKVVERREFTEYVDPPHTEEQEAIDPEDLFEGFEADPTEAALEEFLQNAAGEGYTLRVDRLTHYRQTGKTNAAQPSEYCDDIPLTSDFRQVIKASWGPGTYRIQLKDASRRFRGKWIILSIAAPAVMGSPQAMIPHPQFVQQQVSTQPQQTAAQLIKEQIQAFKELKNVFDSGESGQVDSAPAQNPQVEITKSVIELAKSEPGLAREVVRLAFGDTFGEPKGSESPVLDLMGRLLEKAAPVLLTLLERMSAAAPQPGAPVASLPGALPAPRAAVPVVHQAEYVEQPEAAYMRVIRHIIDDLRANASTYASVDSLFELIEKFPQFEPIVLALVNAQPSQVLARLATLQGYEDIEQIPHSVMWISSLQATFKEEAANAAGEDEQEGGQGDATKTD